MGIESTVEKLDKYYKRFNEGKAARIKPTHVDKAIRKLTAREELLLAELAETEKPSKKTRRARLRPHSQT